MRRWILSCIVTPALMALSGCGFAGFGSTASQLIHKDPATVREAFADAFEQGAMGGASQYSDLWHGGFQILVDKSGADKLDVVTKFDGATSTEVHFTFTPKDNGAATLVNAEVSVDEAVMHKAFQGTSKENLGNLPKIAFVDGMQRMMQKYGERIENGMPVATASEGWQTGPMASPPPEFYEGMAPDQLAEVRAQEAREQQRSAAKPMNDPNADAQRYLNQGGNGGRPTTPIYDHSGY
jgi:hypothetical protein